MDFCCICVKTLENLTSLSCKNDSGVDYLLMLKMCIPQEVWKEYYFICSPCSNQLQCAYEFVEFCLKNNSFRKENLFKDEEKTQLVFHCFDCGKGYKRKAILSSHIRRNHLKVESSKNNVGTIQQPNKDDDKNIEVKDEENKVKNESSDVCLSVFKEENVKLDDLNQELNSDINTDIENCHIESQSDSEEKQNSKKWKRKPKECELCGVIFKTKLLWTAHMKETHKNIKPYACDQCTAQYLNAYSLLIHKRKHNNEKPFVCSTCGKAFISSADLNHHYKTHGVSRPYACQMCDRSFKTHSNLRTHRKQVHSDYKDWQFECEICHKKFPIRSNFLKHMKRHEGIKDFACHICPKKFVNRAELGTHLNTHTNERHFACKLCSKTYRNREGLRRHMKVVHDMGNWKPIKSEKKYLCPMCPKIFAFTNRLQRHIYAHTGERPFACDFCPKKFIDAYIRNSHVKKDHPLEHNLGLEALIIPDELPSILSIIYSNIPTLKKGTDSRFGWGFRLGDRADFQVLTELGPQMYTQPLGNQEDKNNKRETLNSLSNVLYAQRQEEKRQKQQKKTEEKANKDTEGAKWLDSWSKEVSSVETNEPLAINAKPGLGVGEIDAKSALPDDAELERLEKLEKMKQNLKKLLAKLQSVENRNKRE